MFNIIKDSFNITNKYIVLATPLILFSLISSLYLIFSSNGNTISVLLALVLFYLMLAAFLSGWLFMVRKCVTNPQEDDINAFIGEFPAGVGEYFLSMCGLIFVILFLSAIFFAVSYKLGLKYIGDVSDVYQMIFASSGSTESLQSLFLSLSAEKKVMFAKWNILIFFTMIINYFLIMFYSPAIFFKTKNPFAAFFISCKDLLGHKILKNILLFVIIFFVYFILSLISAAFVNNKIIHFVLTLVNFYYAVFAVIYVYNYYYKNFVQIGANIDTRI